MWHEANHSPTSKNAWNYTSTPPIHLHGVALNKAMDASSWSGT